MPTELQQIMLNRGLRLQVTEHAQQYLDHIVSDDVYGGGFLGSSWIEPYVSGAGDGPGATMLSSVWGGAGAGAWLERKRGRPGNHSQAFEVVAASCPFDDFFFGAAGAITVFTMDARPSDLVLAQQLHGRIDAVLHEELVRAADDQAVNLGLSHGLAGFVLAWEIGNVLLGYDGTAKRKSICDVFRKGVIEVDGAYDWPNYLTEREPVYSLCNGNTGIVLALLWAARYSDDDRYLEVLTPGLEGLYRSGDDASFCCGTIGRCEVLLEGFRLTEEAELLDGARALAATLPAALDTTTWQTGDLGRRFLHARLQDHELALPGLPMDIVPLG